MAKNILDWLAEDPSGYQMLRMAYSCIASQKIMVSILPYALSKNVEVTRIQNNLLILTVPSPPFAAKLRQLIPTILQEFNKTEQKITSIKIKIRKKIDKIQDKPTLSKKTIPLGKEALQAFRVLHNELEESSSISKAVAKLLKNHEIKEE